MLFENVLKSSNDVFPENRGGLAFPLNASVVNQSFSRLSRIKLVLARRAGTTPNKIPLLGAIG